MQDMEYLSSSKHQLETWGRVGKMTLWVGASVVIILLLMAATLTP